MKINYRLSVCVLYPFWVNSVPNKKILDKIKLKALADDNLHVGEVMISAIYLLENIDGNREHAVYLQYIAKTCIFWSRFDEFVLSYCSLMKFVQLTVFLLIGASSLIVAPSS